MPTDFVGTKINFDVLFLEFTEKIMSQKTALFVTYSTLVYFDITAVVVTYGRMHVNLFPAIADT